jgi:putative heme-binding domain-containing protein
MLRRLSFVGAGLLVLAALSGWQAQAQAPAVMQWIWFDEGNPLADAPAETRYFRRVFEVQRPSDKSITAATLEITADNRFVVSLNGVRIGRGDDWSYLSRFNVRDRLVNGKNVLTVAATNEGGPAGLVVRLRYTSGKRSSSIVSDSLWKASKTAPAGWEKVDFDDGKWSKAKALGAYGKVGPWGGGGAPARGGPPRFTPAPGFKVEPAVKGPEDRGPFSLVNMTFDPRGRLLLSQEGGPILVCDKPDKSGVMQEVREYCTQVKNCHGMRWVKDALYLVGNGPQGTGVYRCRDTRRADRIDEVTLLHRSNGGMGEHGPHAIINGPDGWLYFVLGNHAWTSIGPKKSPNPEKLADNSPLRRWPTGGMGPDQGKPGSPEDVLLPRLNDANGHAANILAPGGTIWRLDRDGKNLSLVAAGFRNHFDAAFSPTGELFTFDSDMEWDIGLPWYRPVRALHCPPGADFVWRTGAANTPSYYLDSLPALHDTGRGSPVGVEFYDHHRFGEKYRGAFLMADWSLGIIYAVHLKRAGASYTPTVEKLLTGTPLNVTDLEVGPDGAVYFTMGGRGTRGGVYRIVPEEPGAGERRDIRPVGDALLDLEQPLSAWSWSRAEGLLTGQRKLAFAALTAKALDQETPKDRRLRALTLLQLHGNPPANETLLKLLDDKDGDLRAAAVYFLGVNGKSDVKEPLVKCLKDSDALVRRRACEALIRANIEPAVAAVWPLLGEEDRFVRTAARLVLERIDAKKWIERLKSEKTDLVALEATVALCKTDQVKPNAEAILGRLNRMTPKAKQELLDYVRTVQLVCCHLDKAPATLAEIGRKCDELFPHKDNLVNRELATLLTHLKRTKVIDASVHAKLLAAQSSKGDREQQIHYAYCLRLLPEGWSKKEKEAFVDWFEQTKSWTGGNSFNGFLANIFREALAGYTVEDRVEILQSAFREDTRRVHTARVLLQRLMIDRQPEMLEAFRKLKAVLAVREKVRATMPPPVQLREPLAEALLRTVCEHPKDEYFSDLVEGLSSPNKLLVFEAIAALAKIKAKPKIDDGKSFRALLVASTKLDAGNRWKAVELLRHWTNDKQFGAEKGDWKSELRAWSKWFGQTFPKEEALPDVEGDKQAPSKYKYAELLDFLTEGKGRKGDTKKGRAVFEKAQCIKCHRYGKEGEGIGPDLTTLAKRFKRVDVLESIYYPSKVISDQYRSSTIITLKGQRIEGLAAVQGDTITVLQSDGTKVTLRKKDIEQQYASLVSVMPEKLLDLLTKEEIADLFAFLESEPGK